MNTTIFLYHWRPFPDKHYFEIEFRFKDGLAHAGRSVATISEKQYHALAGTHKEQPTTGGFYIEIKPEI